MAGARRALVVANDVYEHEGLSRLRAPAADAEALARVLGDTEIGDFDVRVVRNEPAHLIQERIEELFAESRTQDLLLLHFSCHGLKSESGELYFAARNTRPNRLGSTAVPADFVQRCMRNSRSRSIVLLLDCCYGGAFSQGVTVRAAGDVNVLDSFPGGRLGGGRGRAVITASSAMEYAFEGDQLAGGHAARPSVFTSALVEGLATGDADRDQDGWISLNELYDYVFDRVRSQNPNQTPGRDVEMQGELYLARRSRPVTVPAPLPAEVQEVIDHPLATVRAGAVQELARLRQGRHAGLALAARLALTRLASDDSRTVSAAAAAALTAADQGDAAAPLPTPDDAASEQQDDDGAPGDGTAAPATPDNAAPRRHDDVSGDGGVGRADPGERNPPAPAPCLPWWRRSAVLVAAAALLLAGAVTAVMLIADRPAGPEPREANQFTATSPWRVVVRDAISGMDNGCDVTLTHVDTNEPLPIPLDLFTQKTFQIRRSGAFRWSANDPGCLVFPRAGAGEIRLPFVHDAAGDSDAFQPGDRVTVEVLNFYGADACEFRLLDAADGRQLDVGSVSRGSGPLQLDPGGQARVYVRSLYCSARLSPG